MGVVGTAPAAPGGVDVLTREELLKLYEISIEEYRFQVLLNNQRFQWFTTLDVALITIGTGLLRLSGGGDGRQLTSLVFATGAALALFTVVSTWRQVEYQHKARRQAKTVAQQLGVVQTAVGSTPGWAGPKPWWTKVRWLNYALLMVLAAVNVWGFVYVLVTEAPKPLA